MMAEEGHINFVDVVVAVFAVLAVIVTLILAIIGFKAAAEFTANERRVKGLERFLKQEKEQLFGVSNLTEVCFETFVNLIVLVDIQRRTIENMLNANPSAGATPKVEADRFRAAISRPLEKVLRLSLYFQVMKSKGEERRDFTNALAAHYPDFSTADFLSALAQTRTGADRQALADKAAELEATLRQPD